MLLSCRTSSLVKDLGNANLNTQLYTTLPFYVIGTESGWLPQAQVCPTLWAGATFLALLVIPMPAHASVML